MFAPIGLFKIVIGLIVIDKSGLDKLLRSHFSINNLELLDVEGSSGSIKWFNPFVDPSCSRFLRYLIFWFGFCAVWLVDIFSPTSITEDMSVLSTVLPMVANYVAVPTFGNIRSFVDCVYRLINLVHILISTARGDKFFLT